MTPPTFPAVPMYLFSQPHQPSTGETLDLDQGLDWFYFHDNIIAFQKEASTSHISAILHRLKGFWVIMRDKLITL